jgi:hypothetical protein
MKLVTEPSDDVTVDGRVLAERDGADEVVVQADELLLEVQRPLVKPGTNPAVVRYNDRFVKSYQRNE